MAEAIRVMEVIKSFNIESEGGGAGRFAIDLARAIDHDRFMVSICSLWNYSTLQEQERIRSLQEMNIPVFTSAKWEGTRAYRSMLLAMQGLRSAQGQLAPEIVNTHSEFADVAILPMRFIRHRPKLMRTLHYPFRVEWIKQPLRRALFTNFLFPLLLDLEIGVSQRLVEQLDRRPIARVIGKKAQRVYNAINLERFSNQPINILDKRKSLEIPPDAFVIGTIGRLTEQKGYSRLIEAAASILKQEPNIFFMIIGEGDLSLQLRHQADQLGISSHILFTGARTDIEELLPCMDLFASSSYWEALPTVIMESMAAGVPVVATDIPGTRDLIRDRKNGWLVPAGDADALAQRLLFARKDEKSRQAIAANARRDIQLFSIKSIATEYESIYSKIVGSRRL